MRKWQKRLISAFVLITLAASVPGCGKKDSDSNKANSDTSSVNSNFNPTGLPIVKQPVTLRIITAHKGNKSFEEKDFYKKISEETNVKIEWEEVTGSLQDRINLAIGSGDLPDALYGGFVPNFLEAIEAGLINPLDELIDKYAPNERRAMELYPFAKVASTYTGDNKIYAYKGFGIKPEAAVRAPLFINKVWLDNLGLKVPGTLDELYNVLTAFKTRDPNGNGKADEIPLTFNKVYQDTLGIWGIIDVKTRFHTTIKDGKLVFNPTDTRYRDALSYMNKLFYEGLLDKEFYTQNAAKLVAKGSQKPAILGVFIGYDIDTQIGPANAKDYIALPPVKGPFGDQLWPYNPSELEFPNGLIIFKDCKYPEVAIRWVDHLNDGVNAITNSYGPENYTWKRDEAAKTWWLLDEELASRGISLEEVRNTEGIVGGPDMSKITAITGYTYKPVAGSRDALKTQWTESYRPFLNKEFWSTVSPITPSTEESKEIALLEEEFNKYFDSFAQDAVIKGMVEQKWDGHLKKCKDLQVDRVLKYYQSQYDQLQNILKKK